MKKISYLFLGVLGIMAASCSDSPEPAKPQYNPQQPILASGDIEAVATGVLASSEVINLNTYDDPDNYLVEVAMVTKADSLVDGAKIALKLEVSPTEDFAKFGTITLSQGTVDENVYYADAYQWNETQVSVFGEGILPQVVYYRIPVYVNIQDTEYRYVSPTYYATSGVVSVKRMDPAYVIEENYYVFGPYVGNNTPASGVAMSHEGEDVYANPTFTYTFEVSDAEAAAGYTLMIAPESQHNANGVVEDCYGLGTEPNVLVLGGSPIAIAEAGKYEIQFNANSLWYNIEQKNKLYVPGGANGWSFGNNVLAIMTDGDGNTYYGGYVGLSGAFKITTANNWDNTNYGAGATDGTIDPSGGDISVETPGLYWMTVDLHNLTYTLTPITGIGIIGGFPENSWGSNVADLKMGKIVGDDGSESADYWNWSADVDFSATGIEWKFRMNNDWALNLGGASSNLTQDGANLPEPGVGTYTITLNLSTVPYTYTAVKK